VCQTSGTHAAGIGPKFTAKYVNKMAAWVSNSNKKPTIEAIQVRFVSILPDSLIDVTE
jgi:hypothetical protein